MAAEGSVYRVLRPRRARVVAWTFAVLVIVAALVLAVVMTFIGPQAWTGQDSALLVVLALGGGYLISRFATIRAQPSPEGITVRNILVTTRLVWTDVVRVRFGADDPWVYLVLVSGDDLPVMAVQRSDGAFAQQQVGRLAALVQARGAAGKGRPTNLGGTAPSDGDGRL